MTVFYLQPEEVWDYIQENKDVDGKLPAIIAQDEDYGLDVYVDHVGGEAFLYISEDDNEMAEEWITEDNCEKVVKEMYETYLISNPSDYTDYYPDDPLEDMKEAIMDRDGELTDAVDECLDVIFDGAVGKIPVFQTERNKIIEGFLDLFGEYLKKVHNISIRWPYLDSVNGVETMVEFPYDEN